MQISLQKFFAKLVKSVCLCFHKTITFEMKIVPKCEILKERSFFKNYAPAGPMCECVHITQYTCTMYMGT